MRPHQIYLAEARQETEAVFTPNPTGVTRMRNRNWIVAFLVGLVMLPLAACDDPIPPKVEVPLPQFAWTDLGVDWGYVETQILNARTDMGTAESAGSASEVHMDTFPDTIVGHAFAYAERDANDAEADLWTASTEAASQDVQGTLDALSLAFDEFAQSTTWAKVAMDYMSDGWGGSRGWASPHGSQSLSSTNAGECSTDYQLASADFTDAKNVVDTDPGLAAQETNSAITDLAEADKDCGEAGNNANPTTGEPGYAADDSEAYAEAVRAAAQHLKNALDEIDANIEQGEGEG